MSSIRHTRHADRTILHIQAGPSADADQVRAYLRDQNLDTIREVVLEQPELADLDSFIRICHLVLPYLLRSQGRLVLRSEPAHGSDDASTIESITMSAIVQSLARNLGAELRGRVEIVREGKPCAV